MVSPVVELPTAGKELAVHRLLDGKKVVDESGAVVATVVAVREPTSPTNVGENGNDEDDDEEETAATAARRWEHPPPRRIVTKTNTDTTKKTKAPRTRPQSAKIQRFTFDKPLDLQRVRKEPGERRWEPALVRFAKVEGSPAMTSSMASGFVRCFL